MKIEVVVSKFFEAYQIAAAVAPTRSPKAVLQNLLVVATNDSLTLVATDMEFSARVCMTDGFSVMEGGKFLLPVKTITPVLRECTDETLELEVSKGTLYINGKHSKFKFPTANPDEFPEVQRFNADGYFRVESAKLAAAIRRTVFATDDESSRYALGGILIETDGDTGNIVGTDGRRLAAMKITGEAVGDYEPVGTAVVPARAASLIEKVAATDKSVVEFACRLNDVTVRIGDTELTARLIEGRYPNWRQVIPKEEDRGKVTLAAGTLASLTRQASITTDFESRGVEFTMEPDELRLASSTADIGESDVCVSCVTEGDKQSVTLDNRYVLDFCRVTDAQDEITMGLNGNGPVRLMSSEDYTYVIMPMAKDR